MFAILMIKFVGCEHILCTVASGELSTRQS
jgi:hypothetical protein